jgi:putative salt-induced outer membrane protein YdiY
MRRIIISCLLLTQALLADQVTLKNGDRLSGNILKYDGKNLVLKSDLAGEVTIPWDNVTVVTSAQPLNVTLKDGQRVVGTVTTDGTKFNVATKDTGSVTAARESVLYIRSEPEQKAYDTEIERYKNPRLIDLWTGTFDLGFADTHGNTDTETFTLGANAVRATSRDKITVNYVQIYSSSNASGPKLTTANAKRGGIAYNLDIAPKAFVFGLVNLENDQFQSLDLRFNPAGGAGYHAVKTPNTILDLSVGASMNKEFFSVPPGSPAGTPSVTHTYAEILLGEELTHKFSKTISMHQTLVFYPNLSATGQYRMNFDISAVAAIKKWMSFHLSASDRYITDPLPGFKDNDILFTTGLRFTFAK